MKGKRLYDAERYEVLAAVYAKESTAVTDENVGAYRTKVVKAGEYLYVNCYPLWKTWPTEEQREGLEALKKRRADRKALAKYAKYNNARRVREFDMLVSANFGYNDLHISGTYEHQDYLRRGEWVHRDREQAKRDATNFIRRVKGLLKRHGCDLNEFRWIVCTVTKESRYETNPYPDTHHHHILMHGVPEYLRGEVERLWPYGYCNADRIQPKDKGLADMSGYVARQEGSANGEQPHEKSYRTSRNIKRPEVKVSDKKISRRRVAQIAADVRANANDVFEKIYPGYRLVEQPKVTTSDFVAGAYIWAKLRADGERMRREGEKAKAERLRNQRRTIHGA